jgi:serine/threonine protein kinase
MSESTNKRSRISSSADKPYHISLSAQKRLLSAYTLDKEVGRGVYGAVYFATHKDTGRAVAVKTFIKSVTDGMKEIYVLKLLVHPHIIHLLDVCSDEARSLHMVMERAQHDLLGIMTQPEIVAGDTRNRIKGYFKQLMLGLEFCHGRGYMHRDLKPENLLIMSDMTLKIADWGMAHTIALPEGGGGRHHTPVTTQWYRAPEIYLGSDQYGAAIDIWSAACIFGQMLLGGHVLIHAPMHGTGDNIETNRAQMEAIWRLCGTPNAHEWPPEFNDAIRRSFGSRLNRDFANRMADHRKTERRPLLTDEAIKLMDWMLHLVPGKRPTATEVLQSGYFTREKDAKAHETHEMARIYGHHFKGNCKK